MRIQLCIYNKYTQESDCEPDMVQENLEKAKHTSSVWKETEYEDYTLMWPHELNHYTNSTFLMMTRNEET